MLLRGERGMIASDHKRLTPRWLVGDSWMYLCAMLCMLWTALLTSMG